jgi:hypothetical protein
VVRCGGIYAGPSKGGAYVSPPPPPPTPPLLSLPLRCPKKSRRTPRLYLWGERSSESSFPFVGCVAVARVLLRGFLFRRCRTKRKPFESFATPPFPRLLGWESCRNGRFSCLFSWTGEQSRGPSLVGPVRDESPTNLPRPWIYVFGLPAYANWAVRHCPWANLSGVLHSLPPTALPKLFTLRRCTYSRRNAFSSFGPR